MDVQPGDTVAFLLRNRPEFNLLDAAALHIGATPWSIYLTSAPEQIRQVVEGAGSKVVFCERDLLPKLTTALDGGATDHIVDVEELDRLPAAPEVSISSVDGEPSTRATRSRSSGLQGPPERRNRLF